MHLYEQRIKELFLEALGILMENREEIIGDGRAVMETLADWRLYRYRNGSGQR